MSSKPAEKPTTQFEKAQTPFDRFKEFASVVFQAPKPSLPKVSKKLPSRKK